MLKRDCANPNLPTTKAHPHSERWIRNANLGLGRKANAKHLDSKRHQRICRKGRGHLHVATVQADIGKCAPHMCAAVLRLQFHAAGALETLAAAPFFDKDSAAWSGSAGGAAIGRRSRRIIAGLPPQTPQIRGAIFAGPRRTAFREARLLADDVRVHALLRQNAANRLIGKLRQKL